MQYRLNPISKNDCDVRCLTKRLGNLREQAFDLTSLKDS